MSTTTKKAGTGFFMPRTSMDKRRGSGTSKGAAGDGSHVSGSNAAYPPQLQQLNVGGGGVVSPFQLQQLQQQQQQFSSPSASPYSSSGSNLMSDLSQDQRIPSFTSCLTYTVPAPAASLAAPAPAAVFYDSTTTSGLFAMLVPHINTNNNSQPQPDLQELMMLQQQEAEVDAAIRQLLITKQQLVSRGVPPPAAVAPAFAPVAATAVGPAYTNQQLVVPQQQVVFPVPALPVSHATAALAQQMPVSSADGSFNMINTSVGIHTAPQPLALQQQLNNQLAALDVAEIQLEAALQAEVQKLLAML